MERIAKNRALSAKPVSKTKTPANLEFVGENPLTYEIHRVSGVPEGIHYEIGKYGQMRWEYLKKTKEGNYQAGCIKEIANNRQFTIQLGVELICDFRWGGY